MCFGVFPGKYIVAIGRNNVGICLPIIITGYEINFCAVDPEVQLVKIVFAVCLPIKANSVACICVANAEAYDLMLIIAGNSGGYAHPSVFARINSPGIYRVIYELNAAAGDVKCLVELIFSNNGFGLRSCYRYIVKAGAVAAARYAGILGIRPFEGIAAV